MRARSDVESALWVRDHDRKQLKGETQGMDMHVHICAQFNLMSAGDAAAHEPSASVRLIPWVSLSL